MSIFSLKIWLSLGLKFLIIAFALFCLVVLYFYFAQEKMIFFPQGVPAWSLNRLKNKEKSVEDIDIRTKDRINIRGWLVKNSNLEKSPLIIYFGGNAEEVSYHIWDDHKFQGRSVALINYRGYGFSQGHPTEKNLFEDSLTIYDYFSKRDDIDKNKIVLMGRSIGSGVAVYLAQNRPVQGLVLVTPYDSISSVASGHFPLLPMSLILLHRFDSISRAPEIKVPMLALAASDDDIIPPGHAERLVGKWGGKCTFIIIEGEDHNSISENKEYWKKIDEFLSEF